MFTAIDDFYGTSGGDNDGDDSAGDVGDGGANRTKYRSERHSEPLKHPGSSFDPNAVPTFYYPEDAASTTNEEGRAPSSPTCGGEDVASCQPSFMFTFPSMKGTGENRLNW